MILFVIFVLLSSSQLQLSLAVAGVDATNSSTSAQSIPTVGLTNPSLHSAATSTNIGVREGMRMAISAGHLSYFAPLDPSINNTSQAKIWTDKSDYAPGSVVIIYGSGFAPDAKVALTLTQPNGTINKWSVESNSSGGFATTFQMLPGSYFSLPQRMEQTPHPPVSLILCLHPPIRPRVLLVELLRRQLVLTELLQRSMTFWLLHSWFLLLQLR